MALNRNTSYANLFHHKGVTYCYKRYASLFFAVGITDDENEMIALMFIHRVVEGQLFIFMKYVRSRKFL